jgi:glycosyltransferase involved in cell wall biosynthesis
MKVAFVVQRYGLEINGGAELHCRWIAEHMARHWDVEVLTTRALDYLTWDNHYPAGEGLVNGVRVRRFPVRRPRDPEKFGRMQNSILENEHCESDEWKWLEEEGPLVPGLIDFITSREGEYDWFVFFSYRYYHAVHGILAVPGKSVLVPTAEHDAVAGLRLFKPVFRKPRALIYNSEEERAMIHTLSRNHGVPGDVIGVGAVVPGRIPSAGFRGRYGITEPYVIYIGRIDENKGCGEMFDFFLRFKRETGSPVRLVLVGRTLLKIPPHPDILYLGFLPEEDKFAALAGARLLLMPSFFESLSMVATEAWALGRPVLANARCAVLRGRCERSRAGLHYTDYPEFREALSLMLGDERLRRRMGELGRAYFQTEYTWETIEGKYLRLFGALAGEAA